MNKLAIGICVILVVIIGGLFFISDSAPTGSTVVEIRNVKTFNVTGDHLRFFINGIENPEILVNEGEKVVINFKSTEGFHDWVLDEFNAKTNQVTGEQVSAVEFIADKKGTFEYYCSVGQHRTNGMFGKFIVQ